MTDGTCQQGCLTDVECGSGRKCAVPAFGGGVGECVTKTSAATGGAGGGVSAGGAAGAGGKTGAGATAGAAGNAMCAVMADGTCGPSPFTGAVCCAVLGHVYDPQNMCVVAGASPASVVACVGVETTTSTCVYQTVSACYAKDDGTVLLASAAFAEGILLDAQPCVTTPTAKGPCAGSGGAGGAAAGGKGQGGAGQSGAAGQDGAGQSGGGKAGGGG